MLPPKTDWSEVQQRDGQSSWPHKPHSPVFTEPHRLQRAVGRADSSASPWSFTVPLGIWAGWPLHPRRIHAHWLMLPSSLQTNATRCHMTAVTPAWEFIRHAAQKTRDLNPKPFQSNTLRCNILPTHSSQVPGWPFSRLNRRKIIWKNVS